MMLNLPNQFILASLSDTQACAFSIAQAFSKLSFGILLLQGEMAAGKTTFTSFFVEALGSKDHVQSPTYTLERIYEQPNGSPIFHYDLYRLQSEEDLYHIGFMERLQEQRGIFIIEWPEVAQQVLHAYKNVTVPLCFSTDGTNRILQVIERI